MIKAIVTGHSRGLGEALAAALLQRGVAVLGLSRQGNAALAARHGGALSELALDLGEGGGAALVSWLDSGALSRWLDGGEGTETAILVNNAGTLAPMGLLGMHGARAIAQGVMLNLSAPLMLSDAFCRATRDLSDRRILHVSSGAARTPYAGWSVYCATKAALDHHARAVQLDAVPGLRICALAPGVIDTGMQAEIRASTPERFPLRDRFAEMQASGGLVAPDECAMHLVDFLLDEDFGREPVADLRDLG
ncbi:MAG TPA: SDR family oxidoreductase [Thauera phenylacetica]|nr:SDR family oxidoreductase [Thauera phenylacetica]